MALPAQHRHKTTQPELDLSAAHESLATPDQRDVGASVGLEPRYGEEGPPPPPPPPGTVVLAVGRPYFHDGTVGEGRYARDLPAPLLAAVQSVQVLVKAIVDFAGGTAGDDFVVACDPWELRLGPEAGQALVTRLDGGPGAAWDDGATGDGATSAAGGGAAPIATRTVDAGHSVTRTGAPSAAGGRAPERRAHQWLRGIAALRQSDHAQALASFEAEAAEAVAAGSPQRAAVAYRAAAASARSTGRSDQWNRLLRMAGKSYLEIAESGSTLPQGVFSAYREAARAFLDAGNLPLAQQCLTKALTVGEALGLVERG